jgi:hypothetical protein
MNPGQENAAEQHSPVRADRLPDPREALLAGRRGGHPAMGVRVQHGAVVFADARPDPGRSGQLW